MPEDIHCISGKGSKRKVKKASEAYWAGKITAAELQKTGAKIRTNNWKTQKQVGIDLVPCNDFSFHDQMLNMSILLGVIP